MARDKVLTIEGLDCADCAMHLEKAVSRFKGVKSARVNLGSSTLVVNPESADLDIRAVAGEVRKLGYRVADGEKSGRLTLFIEGMDCADEVDIIEMKMRGLKGISSHRVNLVKQNLSLVYDSSLVSPQDIVKAIAETGMKARLQQTGREVLPWWQETRIVLVAASGILTLIGFILGWLTSAQWADEIAFGLAVVVGGYYPAKIGLAGLRGMRLNIYTLMIAAAIGAIALGLWHEAALLIFIYSLSGVVENYAVNKARGSLKALMSLVPREALVRRNGAEMVLPVEEIEVGETFIVRPGEKIPLDGIVVGGASSVDQSTVTGESMPVGKSGGDEVFAGTMNQRGSMEVQVTRLSQDTTLARIIHSVEEAEARKSGYQRFAERWGRYYTSAMFLAALGTATIPLALGLDFSQWFYRALVLLVVSCSCGLVISVPVSVVAAVTNAARRGILIKGGGYLEAAAGVRAVLFDKTGTLTIGRPQVTDVKVFNSANGDLLSLAAAIESRSEHPLADAILNKAREEGRALPEVADFESITGLGARARVDGRVYYAGSRRLFETLAVPLGSAEAEIVRLEGQGKTTVLVGSEGEILGAIAVADALRPESVRAVEGLRRSGIKHTVMLTGDNEDTARAISLQAGVDEYRADLLPEDKVEAVKEFRRMYGRVAMVGDGVNDAPAMAAADVGIAMGAAGTDVAMETGDLALMSDDLSRIPYALHLSRRTLANMKQNIAAAMFLSAGLVIAALVGQMDLVPGLLINEMGMLLVIANGLRLLR